MLAKSNRHIKPRARKEGLVVQQLSDETLVYDLDRDLAHCLNQTASLVWSRCDGRATAKEIACSVSRNLNQPVDEKVVWLALDQLSRNHLLAESPMPLTNFSTMDRREVVRALGITAAVAIPMVASIVAPTPAQAASQLPDGSPCSSPAECQSGICSGGCCTRCL